MTLARLGRTARSVFSLNRMREVRHLTRMLDLEPDDTLLDVGSGDGYWSAKFAESFVKLGIIPGDGGAWLLPRVVGYSKACEMAFTGDMLSAAEALACGLVSKVVPDAGLMAEARKLADRIAANPPHAVRMTKRLIREGQHVQLATLLELSAAMQSLAHATADHKEAVAAFMEKRKPEFGGA